jgi:predicted transcriptional regulator
VAEIASALAAAEAAVFTRPAPKSFAAQIRFLVRQAKGSTRRVAEQLGVSPRSVQRYLTGERTRPPAAIRDRTQREVEQRWQPRVRARARRQAEQHGISVELRARFGFTAAPGSSDDPRVRRMTQTLPPAYAQQLLDASTEAERRKALGDGLGEVYFRDGGSRAAGLDVEVTDIDYIDISYR